MKKLSLLFLAVFTLCLQALSQSTNALYFTNIVSTPEQAIQLTWASTPGDYYQIQCANALATNADGSTAWFTLYDDYPAQGTNTFWLDCGNFAVAPYIPHPKYSPMRFYRVLDEGTDDLTNDEPQITITSPSSGMVVTGDLVVSICVTSDQAMVTSQLYIDGQLMNPSPDGTNYYINTCEWYNGEHTLFAVAKEESTSGMQINSSTPIIGHAVSAFVPVYFSNLIQEISFSQPFFQPSLGQTQEVMATFAANCNWTLQIMDEYSNEFRTVTGSGDNLDFLWDGTSDTGTNVPNGIYYYYVSAATNGLANEIVLGGGGDGTNSGGGAPLPDFMGVSQLYVTDATETQAPVPFAIYPPGFNTNNLVIFSASPSDIASLHSSSLASSSVRSSGITFSPDDAGGGSGTASSQDASAAPSRPGSNPIVNATGTFGYGVQNYDGNGSAGYQPTAPRSSTLIASYVTLQGIAPASPPTWKRLANCNIEANNLDFILEKYGWINTIAEFNDALTINQLKASGSNNPFNGVDFAFLSFHGCYGTSIDMWTGQNIKQMYFPITSGTSAQYLRMSDFNLGGPSPGVGLKWVILNACHSLYPANWNSMQSQRVYPYNSNLHMILGGATDLAIAPDIGTFLGEDLTGHDQYGKVITPMTIRASWYDALARGMAADVSQSFGDYENPTQATTAYDNNCGSDILQSSPSTTLSGTWTIDPPQTVYPAP